VSSVNSTNATAASGEVAVAKKDKKRSNKKVKNSSKKPGEDAAEAEAKKLEQAIAAVPVSEDDLISIKVDINYTDDYLPVEQKAIKKFKKCFTRKKVEKLIKSVMEGTATKAYASASDAAVPAKQF